MFHLRKKTSLILHFPLIATHQYFVIRNSNLELKIKYVPNKDQYSARARLYAHFNKLLIDSNSKFELLNFKYSYILVYHLNNSVLRNHY